MLASDLIIFVNRYYKTSPGMIILDKAGLSDTEFFDKLTFQMNFLDFSLDNLWLSLNYFSNLGVLSSGYDEHQKQMS